MVSALFSFLTVTIDYLVHTYKSKAFYTIVLLSLFVHTAAAQSPKEKSRLKWKVKMQIADSLRLQMRKASDEGRLLLWADSIRRNSRSYNKSISVKDSTMLQRLSRYDRILHTGDSILIQRYHKVNYDTTYIGRPSGRWTVKVRGNLTGAEMIIKGKRDNSLFQTNLETKSWGSMSMAVSYRGITAGLAINPLKLAGLNKDYELNTNSYGNRMGFDVVFLSSKTYQGKSLSNGREMPIEKGSVFQKALNLNFYYVFNAKRFSFPAAFSQSYLQLRSAGSLIMGASLDGQITDIAANEVNGGSPAKQKLVEFGIGLGYGYNLVAWKHWLFHLSAVPTFNLYTHSHIIESGQRVNMRYRFPSLITTERGAIVYSWSNKFLVATMVYNYSVVGDKKYLQVTREKWRMRITYGFRF